jgi:2-keto-3-deoxy-L-fuconate dehydrogenase
MSGRLAGKRVVVTEADRFMGPALTKGLAEAGADVVADTRDQRHREAAKATIAEAGRVDALIANLAEVNARKSVVDTSDPEWAEMYDVMVHRRPFALRGTQRRLVAWT